MLPGLILNKNRHYLNGLLLNGREKGVVMSYGKVIVEEQGLGDFVECVGYNPSQETLLQVTWVFLLTLYDQQEYRKQVRM